LKVSLLINSALLVRKYTPNNSSSHLKEAISISKQINRYDLLAIAKFSLGYLSADTAMSKQAKKIFFAIDQEEIYYHLKKELEN
ncbi:hypothetical protein L0897_002913, partial [Listeria innocua]|nr:hypothetical protein [Listeria innocua]EIZ1980213.1 hypothetical protein [Listeria innocua]